jgi:HTH-like domain
MIDRGNVLPIARQASLLRLSRSSIYYLPRPVPPARLAIMHRIDALHLEHPFAGSRMLRDMLRAEGITIGRLAVATLMRRMGIEALYRRPSTSKPAPGHKIYPYLLRNLVVDRPNQVWAMDITYIPMARGFCQRRLNSPQKWRMKFPHLVAVSALATRPPLCLPRPSAAYRGVWVMRSGGWLEAGPAATGPRAGACGSWSLRCARPRRGAAAGRARPWR